MPDRLVNVERKIGYVVACGTCDAKDFGEGGTIVEETAMDVGTSMKVTFIGPFRGSLGGDMPQNVTPY